MEKYNNKKTKFVAVNLTVRVRFIYISFSGIVPNICKSHSLEFIWRVLYLVNTVLVF